MINAIIARYRILKKLGAGGMGEVYLAEDMELGRKAALKFLPPQYNADPELKARFKREARAAAALNHPHIITIYDIGEHQGKTWMAMEYVDGESLKDLIVRQELDVDEALDIAVQICEGLGEAHRAGVVHRDIKPANILLDKNGRVKIADFGLARLEDATALTGEGAVMGTPAYMSPEQVRGKKLDGRSDIFSLGVTLYELITRRLPFKGETRNAVFFAILNDEPEPLARYKRGVPAGLQRIMDKVLDKDREARYQHAADLRADLKRERKLLPQPGQSSTKFVAPKPPANKPVPEKKRPMAPPPPTAARSSRRVWLLAGIALALVVLVWLVYKNMDWGQPLVDPPLLSITTTPANATVLLDGNAIGATPIISYRANTGKVALRIWKTNYFTIDTAVVLAKGRETKLSFRLQPAFARVTLRIDPADAEVILDGKSYAAAQREKLPLDIGLHRLNLSREGYIPKQIEFRVAAARDTTVRFALDRNLVAEYGVIRVEPGLDGRLFIGEKFEENIAAGEVRIYNRPVGSYKVEVKGARENVSQTVSVVKGKTVTVVLQPKPAPKPVEPKITRAPVLRSSPRNELSVDEVKSMLAAKGFFDNSWNKTASGFANDYALRTIGGEQVVVDNATGLMWQRGGSSNYMTYADAEKFINQLNTNRFADFSDWRLPTLEEAMSLMEPSELNAGLYIDPKFDKTQRYIWTTDKQSAGVAWVAFFDVGVCDVPRCCDLRLRPCRARSRRTMMEHLTL
jgi:serine/threonine protein kinase